MCLFHDRVAATLSLMVDHMAGAVVRLLQDSADSKFQIDILSGMREALVGVPRPVAPAAWSRIWPEGCRVGECGCPQGPMC